MAESAATLERYEVLNELAFGTQGVVLRALDLETNRVVAIKQFSLGARTSYLREIAASLDNRHKNLLTPLDTFYRADGVGIVVYEFFAAGNLRQNMTPGEPYSLSLILRCAQDLLQALAHLHKRKFIHCDVKPENVFINQGPDGEIAGFLLGDLGSTCSMREAEQGEHRTGSPAYSAPERLYQKFFPNSDLYSLGVLLFELATGNLPFTGGPREIARAHLQQPVPLAQVPNAFLQNLIGGLMEKDPSRRIKSADRALMLLTSVATDIATECLPPIYEKISSPTMNIAKKSKAVIGRRAPSEKMHTTIPAGFDRLHVLDGNEGPLLVVESANDIVITPVSGRGRSRMISKSGSVHLVGDCDLFYQLDSTVHRFNPNLSTPTIMHDRCLGAIDFVCDGQRLLWRTRRSAHLLDLRTREESSFLIPHYLLEPRSHLLENSDFAVSAGLMNSQISLRSSQGVQKRLQELDGPIIDLVSEPTVLLAVTLNVKQKDSYAVWRIAQYSEPQRLDLPLESRVICTTEGHVFWLVDNVNIFQCGIGLAPRLVFKLSEPICGFAVSQNHHWIVTWSKTEGKTSRVCLYSTAAEIVNEKVAS